MKNPKEVRDCKSFIRHIIRQTCTWIACLATRAITLLGIVLQNKTPAEYLGSDSQDDEVLLCHSTGCDRYYGHGCEPGSTRRWPDGVRQRQPWVSIDMPISFLNPNLNRYNHDL